MGSVASHLQMRSLKESSTEGNAETCVQIGIGGEGDRGIVSEQRLRELHQR